jgi:hypothetical protein
MRLLLAVKPLCYGARRQSTEEPDAGIAKRALAEPVISGNIMI